MQVPDFLNSMSVPELIDPNFTVSVTFWIPETLGYLGSGNQMVSESLNSLNLDIFCSEYLDLDPGTKPNWLRGWQI